MIEMNKLQESLMYDKIASFLVEGDENWQKFMLNDFIEFLSKFWDDNELIKRYIDWYANFFTANYNFEAAKDSFELLKKRFNSKTIVEFITKLELDLIFSHWNEKEFLDKNIQEYIDSLIKTLSWESKEYWLAIKTKLIDKDSEDYFDMMKKLAYTGYEPAIETYKSLLEEKFEKVIKEDEKKELEKEFVDLATFLEDYAYVGDFYYNLGNFKKAIEYYEIWLANWDMESYFLVIDTYFELYKSWDKDAESMINYYMWLLEDMWNLNEIYKLKLEALKWDFSFKIINDKNTAFEFYYSAFKKAVELKEQDYIENLWITIFNYFFDFLSHDDMFSVVKEVQIVNPNSDISFKFYEVSKDYVNFLALSLELSLYNIPEKLYYFIDKQIEEAIKKLSYKDLFSIVDIKSIEKEYPWILLTEEVLRWMLDGSFEYIDKEKLSNKQNDLVNKDEFLSDLVVKVVEEEFSDWGIKLEDDEEKILKELWLDLSPNFLEDIEKVNKEILYKLETINDLITLLELKERVNGYYESEKEVNIYDVFSLFTLLEPKTKNPKILWDYFNKLNGLYLSQVPYINVWIYTFLRNIYINSIPENTEEEKEFKWKIEYAFWNLETKWEILKESKLVPEFVLNTFMKILKYETLNEKDLGVVELILSSDLEWEIWYIVNEWFINGNTKFINMWDGVLPINSPKELSVYEEYYLKKNKIKDGWENDGNMWIQ